MERLAPTIIALSIIAGLLLSGLPVLEDEVLRSQEIVLDANGTVVNQTGESKQEVGIVADRRLRFGSIPVGAGSTKFLNLNSPGTSLLLLRASGNISEHLEMESLMLLEGSREVSVRFNGTSPGYYEGELTIKTWTAKGEWGKRWLGVKHRLYQFWY